MRRKNISVEQGKRVLERLAQGSRPDDVACQEKIDISSVYKIRSKANKEATQQKERVRPEDSPLWKEHRDQLMPTLLGLKGIGQFALADDNLINWYARTDNPRWPITQGHGFRLVDGSVSVELAAETKAAWGRLKGHLPEDPVWEALEQWKRAMAADLEARFSLLESILAQVKSPEAEGGLGLAVDPEMSWGGSAKPAVSLRYAFAIHAQLMAGYLGLGHRRHQRDDFQEDPFRENPLKAVINLAGIPVISSEDCAQRNAAIEFFLRFQTDSGSLLEVQKAGKAYQIAGRATEEVIRCLDDLDLMLVFPPNSRCKSCPS